MVAVAILHSIGERDDMRLADTLSANDVGVVCVPAGVDFEAGVRLAAEHFPSWLPRMVAASGSAVPAAQREARRAGLSGAVLLNAPVGRSIGRGLPATIVFVDRDLMSERLWGRMASRLGNASFHVIDTEFDGQLRAWLAQPGAVVRDQLAGRAVVGAMVAAASLLVVPAAAPLAASASPAPVSVSADPFAGGVSVDASQIAGDGTGVVAAKAEKSTDGGAEVPASAILGDGTALVAPAATGSIQIVGGNGMKYFVNTNITFATTSSASAAMSEASFTAAQPATTLNGATTASTLNDAFDGYNALFVDVAPFADPPAAQTGNAEFIPYNQLGAAPVVDSSIDPECTNREVVFPTAALGGLDVHREVWVPGDGNYSRTLNVVTNPTGAAISARLITGNNIGSDSNTMLVGSSSADATAEVTDTWVTSMQNFSGVTSADPRLGHVLQGVGAPVPLSVMEFVNGDDNPDWGWDVTVQPGETVRIVTFVVAEYTKARAEATSAQLAQLDPAVEPLRCLTDDEASSIVNFFALPDVDVAPVDVEESAGTAVVTFTRAAAGPPATVTYSLTDGGATTGVDYTPPATLEATFADGATTAEVQIPIVDDALLEPSEDFRVTITNVTGFGAIGASPSALVIIGPSDRYLYTPVTPFRAIDTRDVTNGRLAAGGTGTYVLPSRPDGAVAVTLNVTAVGPDGPGYLALYPCDQPRPATSNVNYATGGATPNQVTVALSPAGEVCVYSLAASDVLLDVSGWWAPTGSGSLFEAVVQDRVVDSRPGLQPAGSTLVVDLAGKVPANAVAVSLNVTTDQAAAPGYVTLYTCGESLPVVSNVNQVPGTPRPNLATVKLSADTTVCAYVSSDTALIVDLVGAWTPASGLSGLTPDPTPDRVYDSRDAGSPVAAGTIRQVAADQNGTMFVNLTATNTSTPGFLAAFPCGEGYSDTSNVNYGAVSSSSTAAIVDASQGGVCVYSSATADVIVDVFGTMVRVNLV